MIKSAVASLLLWIGCCLSSVGAQSGQVTTDWQNEEARQFDFWIGKWDVNLRMIQGDNSWKDSVAAKTEIYSILDGKAILELWNSPTIKGFSLRYFEPESKKWILYLNWPSDSRSNVGSLTGEFRHGRGQFYSSSQQPNGKRSISRYTFCDISPTSLRWDDAYSKDGGKTWANNWIMEFSRTAATAQWPRNSTKAHTFDQGGRCVGPEFEAINSIAGRWAGELEIHENESVTNVAATLNVFRILDGCTVVRFLEYTQNGKTFREFGLLTFNKTQKRFEELRLDNRVGTKAEILGGRNVNGVLKLTVLKKQAGANEDRPNVVLRNEWTLPDLDNDRVRFTSSMSKDRENWTTLFSGSFERVDAEKAGQDQAGVRTVKTGIAINQTCPRSGKPVATDSIAEYRGHVVGFCNSHCRDDFVANVDQRPDDREFFDDLIDGHR